VREVADADWTRAGWIATSRCASDGACGSIPTTSSRPRATRTSSCASIPGLAFGTGTHPTTALCLEWLDALDARGATVVDYGCGSGMLAIAALKLGAARAIGIDNDPQALVASRDNAERNGVSDRARVVDCRAARPRGDVVVANILAGALVDARAACSSRAAPRLRRSRCPASSASRPTKYSPRMTRSATSSSSREGGLGAGGRSSAASVTLEQTEVRREMPTHSACRRTPARVAWPDRAGAADSAATSQGAAGQLAPLAQPRPVRTSHARS
jgi:hypothetical protein